MKFVQMKSPGLVLILLFSSLISFAQVERKPSPAKQADSVSNNPGGNKTDKGSRKDLVKELDLSKEQKGKLKEIRQANMAKKEAIENNSQLSETEKKKQLRDLQKEQAQNILAILTDEQKEKFKASRKKAMKENN
jgi:Spy/CpxP family protein refolding chaperone